MAQATNDPTALIARIESLLADGAGDEQKLRRALSLAAEAARTPAGDHRHELLRDARQLVKQATRS